MTTAERVSPRPIPTGVAGCSLITIRQHRDGRGGLAFIEGSANGDHPGLADLPFAIARVYYAWGMEPGTVRGEHAHRQLQQVYIAVHGEFDVVLEDAVETRRVRLDDPSKGLYLGHMVWRRLENFSDDAVCLVLASAAFDEADYFRDKQEFLRAVTHGASDACAIS